MKNARPQNTEASAIDKRNYNPPDDFPTTMPITNNTANTTPIHFNNFFITNTFRLPKLL